MSSTNTETNGTPALEAPTDKQQLNERNAKNGAAPPLAPRVRPWTSEFLLPSVRFKEPKPAPR
jgi:hypothetical protein